VTELNRPPAKLGRKTLSILVQAIIDQLEYEFPPADGYDIAEIMLWRRVIYQAIRDAAEGDQEARQFFSTEDLKEISDRAALDPEAVRRRVKAQGWVVL
jgi:hypothetical protein